MGLQVEVNPQGREGAYPTASVAYARQPSGVEYLLDLQDLLFVTRESVTFCSLPLNAT